VVIHSISWLDFQGCGTSNVCGLSKRLSLRNPSTDGKNRTLSGKLPLAAFEVTPEGMTLIQFST